MTESKLLKGWTEDRVKEIIEHYEGRRGEDTTEEPQYNAAPSTSMDVPLDLVPKVRQLIAKRKAS